MPPIKPEAIAVRKVVYYSMANLRSCGIRWAKQHEMSATEFHATRPFVVTKVDGDQVQVHAITTQPGNDRIPVENESGDGKWRMKKSYINDPRNYWSGSREAFSNASQFTDHCTNEDRRPCVTGRTLDDLIRRKGMGRLPPGSLDQKESD